VTSRFFSKIPYHHFAPPGAVKVSVVALGEARKFSEDVKRVRPDAGWVIVFEWAESRIVRKPADGPRVELGAGLDLVVYERDQLPADVLALFDGVEIAIKISPHVYEKSRERLIDVDITHDGRLTLR
jgi:hypothetical protein